MCLYVYFEREAMIGRGGGELEHRYRNCNRKYVEENDSRLIARVERDHQTLFLNGNAAIIQMMQ